MKTPTELVQTANHSFVDSYRKLGTAATWACVAAGRAWGCDTIALQASDMGLPIYAAMGFRTVVRYAIFRQPKPA